MDINTLTEREDPMGAAIRDYFRQGKSAQLKVLQASLTTTKCPWPISSALITKCRLWSSVRSTKPEEKCLMSVLVLVAMPWPCRSAVLTSRQLIYRP